MLCEGSVSSAMAAWHASVTADHSVSLSPKQLNKYVRIIFLSRPLVSMIPTDFGRKINRKLYELPLLRAVLPNKEIMQQNAVVSLCKCIYKKSSLPNVGWFSAPEMKENQKPTD